MSDFFRSFASALRDLMPEQNRPVVVFSAVWPFFRELGRADKKTAIEILDVVLNAAGERAVLMPTFSRGYRNGVCDLDVEPSTTGVLSQEFLSLPKTRRSLSAFFSFAVSGNSADGIENLQPVDAWGDGSLYAWMQDCNARMLLLGTHPTHSSFLHRLEWLARDRIPYRYRKSFHGTIVRGQKTYECTETLYVRELNPEAVNDLTVLVGPLKELGMETVNLKGVTLSAYDAQPVVDTILPQILADPLMLLANRGDFGG